MTATVQTPPEVTTAPRPGLLAAASGIGLTVAMFGVSAPETPAEFTAESARAYLTDNAAQLRTFGFAMAGSAVLLVVLLAHLRTLIARTHGSLADVAFGSGLLCAVWLLVSGAMHASAAMDGVEGTPDAGVISFTTMMTLGDTVGAVSTYAKGACLLAVGVAAVRTRFLPRWLGWLSIALGAMAVGGGLGVVDNPVTPALWYGGLIGFAVWPLVVGVVLAVRAVRARRA
jgi:hypothetical protein